MNPFVPRQNRASFVDRVGPALRRVDKLARRKWLFDRAFSGSLPQRVLLVSVDERVAQSQLDPFHRYSDALARRYGAEFREVPVEHYVRGERPAPRDATTVCFQTSFDIPTDELRTLLARLKEQNPGARFVYLDWFSPTDLRLAEALDPHISLYVKRHVLRDRGQYQTPTYGDTTLMDYYGRRFGLDHSSQCFHVPPQFFAKLLIGPSFVTADYIVRAALTVPPSMSARPFDLQARIAIDGTEWYRHMRSECAEALENVSDLRIATGGRIHPVAYLRELRASKVCFSPFGYGEVCWRDYEAIANGAVLVKPDMSHLETEPDLFLAGETYVPVRWDLADFEDKVRWLLGRPGLCREIAANAFTLLNEYVKNERFVGQAGPILSGSERAVSSEASATYTSQRAGVDAVRRRITDLA